MATRRFFAGYLLAAALAAVAPESFPQPRPVPVTDPSVPVEMPGIQVMPPPGTDWLIVRDYQNLMFGKRIDSKTHSFAAIAFIRATSSAPSSPEDLVDFVKTFKARGFDARRNRLLEEEFTPATAPAPDCVRYRFRLEDTGAPFAKGEKLLQEDFGFICLHPESRNHFVDARYTERGGPQPSSAQMREEGEAFLRGIKFVPLPAK